MNIFIKRILKGLLLLLILVILLTLVIIGNPNHILKDHRIIQNICGWGGTILISFCWWDYWWGKR